MAYIPHIPSTAILETTHTRIMLDLHMILMGGGKRHYGVLDGGDFTSSINNHRMPNLAEGKGGLDHCTKDLFISFVFI